MKAFRPTFFSWLQSTYFKLLKVLTFICFTVGLIRVLTTLKLVKLGLNVGIYSTSLFNNVEKDKVCGVGLDKANGKLSLHIRFEELMLS
jgi:hypothetical protein